MRTRIQKWGNSLALRIPKVFASEVGLKKDTEVEIFLEKGRLIITPIEEKINLERLLTKVTEENKHKEIDTGSKVGKEIW
jgi:antitoxin MazE